MSQRTNSFTGGIQQGTTAISPASLALEDNLRVATQQVTEMSSYGWRRGFSAAELATHFGVDPQHMVGVYPDGGIWFLKDDPSRILVAAEAKKQGATGNAIERWYKNEAVLTALGTTIYVTFCSGEGFFDQNPAQRSLEASATILNRTRQQKAGPQFWNHPFGSHWFYRYPVFASTSEIKKVLLEALQVAEASL